MNIGGNGVTVFTAPTVDPNRLPSTGPYPVTFWVRNPNATSVGADFTCSVLGPVTCAGVTPTFAVIPAGDSVSVSLTYSTTAGRSGSAFLYSETGRDQWISERGHAAAASGSGWK